MLIMGVDIWSLIVRTIVLAMPITSLPNCEIRTKVEIGYGDEVQQPTQW
jgi:hypothetical protein